MKAVHYLLEAETELEHWCDLRFQVEGRRKENLVVFTKSMLYLS